VSLHGVGLAPPATAYLSAGMGSNIAKISVSALFVVGNAHPLAKKLLQLLPL
jgi:hypothetical protein